MNKPNLSLSTSWKLRNSTFNNLRLLLPGDLIMISRTSSPSQQTQTLGTNSYEHGSLLFACMYVYLLLSTCSISFCSQFIVSKYNKSNKCRIKQWINKSMSNFILLCRRQFPSNKLKYKQRHPTNSNNYANFPHKLLIDFRSVKIVPK